MVVVVLPDFFLPITQTIGGSFPANGPPEGQG